MDLQALDKALEQILKQRQQLESIDYSDNRYDDLEEELHDLEDDFQTAYGDYLEEALQDVHDEYCPDNDVLMPIAYLGDGVLVEVDEYPGKDTRLMIVPNPTRIILTIGKDKQEVVWTAK